MMNNEDAGFIAAVMAIGFITFYSPPGGIPFVGRLTVMVALQFAVGMALRRAEA